jgi:transcriptional regulator with XRE-family HTH domain
MDEPDDGRTGGMGEGERIGRRLRSARLRRGMSLRTLAGLSGLSTSFLSMVENGQRHLDRTGHINALAEALQVAPAELLGQPYPPAGPASGTAHEAVPAIRLTLMGAHSLQDSAPAAVMPTPALAERVTRANRLYHACEYGALAHALPDLLTDLHAAVAAASPQQRPGVLRLTAQAYYPACTLLLKSLGYTDLAFLAVTRAADVTAELDDPSYSALSGFFHTHVLMAAGSPDQAYAHAEQAADLVETNLHDQATGRDRAPLALLGELHLIRATALTQQVHRPGSDRTDQVRAHLREAHTLAARTGETRAWHLNFGPMNVGIHQVSLHTDLGLYGRAVHAGQTLRTAITAPPGRTAAFHTDLGRARAHQRGQHTEAVAELLTAERTAPERVHASAAVRQTVSALLSRPLPAHTTRDLRGLAHRIGL